MGVKISTMPESASILPGDVVPIVRPQPGEDANYKFDLGQIITTIQLTLVNGTIAALVENRVYTSYASLQADVSPNANDVGLVLADPDPFKIDFYVKVGASGTGSWTALGFNASAAQAAAAIAVAAATDPNVVAIGEDLLGPNTIGTVAAISDDVEAVADDLPVLETIVDNLDALLTIPSASAAAIAAAASVGTYPEDARYKVPRGLTAVAVGVAGTGGSNGTNIAVVWTAGNWIYNPTVYVDIVGGAVTNARVIDPGLVLNDSPVTPTATIPGAGGTATLTLTAGTRVANGASYWALNNQGTEYAAYRNVNGVATLVPDLTFPATFEPGLQPYDYSQANYSGVVANQSPLTFVDAIGGNDTTGNGSFAAPYQSILKAKLAVPAADSLIYTKASQRFVTRDPAGFAGIVSFATSTFPQHPYNTDTYGPGARPSLFDSRQDLSAKTFTLVSGSSVSWETTFTLGSIPLWAGINIASGTKPTLYLMDSVTDDQPAGKSLPWKTNGANVAANDAAIEATAGTYGINYVGSTLGDIRNSGSTSTGPIRLVVHLPDGSNPNGKALFFSDLLASCAFIGGYHGNVRLIGGAGKDNASFSVLAGVIPSFMNLEVIEPPCHGGVGARDIIGKFLSYARPVEGEQPYSFGQTFGGGGLHLFTPIDLTSQDITIGEYEVGNFGTGVYMHGSGNRCYRSVTFQRRSKSTNCRIAAGADAPAVDVSPNLVGITWENGLDAIKSGTCFNMADPLWVCNGGSWKADNIDSQSNLVSFRARNPASVLRLTNFVVDCTDVNVGAPDFHLPQIFAWIPFGGMVGGQHPRLILNRCRDWTRLISNAKRKMQLPAPTFTDACRVHLELYNSTQLGQFWNFSNWEIYPESLVCDSTRHILGLGNHTRAEVRATMASLGRLCTLPDTVTMVGMDGVTVVDPPSI